MLRRDQINVGDRLVAVNRARARHIEDVKRHINPLLAAGFFRAGRCESQTGGTRLLNINLTKVTEDVLKDSDSRDSGAIEVPLVSIDCIIYANSKFTCPITHFLLLVTCRRASTAVEPWETTGDSNAIKRRLLQSFVSNYFEIYLSNDASSPSRPHRQDSTVVARWVPVLRFECLLRNSQSGRVLDLRGPSPFRKGRAARHERGVCVCRVISSTFCFEF